MRGLAVMVALCLGAACLGAACDAPAPPAPSPATSTPPPSPTAPVDEASLLELARSLGLAGPAPGTVPKRLASAVPGTVGAIGYGASDGSQVIVELAADRSFVTLLRELGVPAEGPISTAGASERARRLFERLGIEPPEEPEVRIIEGLDYSTSVRWPRSIEGVDAPDEGDWIVFYRDGTLRSLSHLASPALPAPGSPLPPSSVLAAARDWLATTAPGWHDPASDLIGSPFLVWVRPDGTLGGGAREPGSLRLCWSVPVTDEAGTTVELRFDAADGSGVSDSLPD